MKRYSDSITQLLVVGVLAFGPLLPVLAQDAASWPQFKRDALRSGDNPGAVLEFPLQRTTAVRFPAPIYASPAVVDGMVYVQDARGHVACIDSRKNTVVWVASIGGINNASSPAVADGKVYIGSTENGLVILNARTGEVIERVAADGGVITAPAVANGAVYFSTFNGKLVKADLAGKVIWTFDGGRISTCEFSIRDKEILFFAGSDNTIFHHLKDEGDKVTVLSKTPAPGQCCPSGGPVFVGEDHYAFQSFDSEYGRFHLMSLREDAKKAAPFVQDVYDGRVMASVRGPLVYRGDKCFTTGGGGIKQLWRADPTALYDGGSHSSPALGKDFLAVGTELGAVHFFALEGKDPVRKPLWQFSTDGAGKPNGAVSSSPAVVSGGVFFGGEDGILYGLGKGTEVKVIDAIRNGVRPAREKLEGSEWRTPGGDMGYSYVSSDRSLKPPFKIQWKTRVWSSFKGPMIVADGRVYCGGRMGPLLALDAATGEILWKVHHPGVESRPSPTFFDGKILQMRVRNGQGDSPFVAGPSGGPPGEGVWCHDAATGKLLWHQPMPFRYHFNPDGLAAHAGKVFVEQLDKEGNLQAVAFALDSGKEAWRQTLTDLTEPKEPPKANPDVKPLPKGLRLPPRFSGVIAEGLWCVSVSDRGTLGLDPETGKIVWVNKEVFISNRARIAARNGALVVFTTEGDHALDPKTGKLLWKNPSKNSYAQALSDLYLESQGKKDLHPSGRCWWPVLANGIWYSHSPSSSNNRLVATADGKTVWSHDFLSNACPSPSPAYGRMYYSPNAEGVIYCFTNANR